MSTTQFVKKTITSDAPEPALNPPPISSETTFLKKPKLGAGKSKKREIPDNVATKCDNCSTIIFNKELEDNLKVCPHCQHHLPISARARIHSLVETCTFEEMDSDMISVDVLKFTGVSTYESKLEGYKKRSGSKDAVVTGIGKIAEHRVGLGVMDFAFLGGSMGSVVGEKLARLIEQCTARDLPVIIISASGGARMYEGMFSLMQMAKTCGALAYHARKKLPYISVLTDPTTAGVMASYASVGDLIIAEPGAMIGFAGPRVIKDTTQAELPPGFQTAEFLLDHGLIDAIIHRKEMKKQLAVYLDFLTTAKRGVNIAS
jgi:acetyl-CoA carboxylase carboxyl transferase subunit beta